METEPLAEIGKKKRVRKAPYRKWSEQEQQELVNFRRENRPIERPTAQIYYKRFLSGIGSELEWTLVRCKVKNLRQSYIRAKSWSNSTGAGTMQDGETTHDVLRRMCPFFEELEEIFQYREYQANAFVIDTEDSNIFECSSSIDDTPPSVAAANDEIDDNTSLTETPRAATQIPRCSRKGIYSRTALADVLEVHSSLVDIKRMKLDADREFREKEFLLKEKEFNFDKEKHASAGRFKILELEMKERIALKEIEMKERLEMAKVNVQK